MRKKHAVVSTVVSLLFLFVFLFRIDNPLRAAQVTMNIVSNGFNPPVALLNAGDKVRFENEDPVPHTLDIKRATDSAIIHTESFDAKTSDVTDTYTPTFSIVGTFNLYLDNNAVSQGSVIVSPATASPTISPTATSMASATPTASSTASATASPTVAPTEVPTASPTVEPSATPTVAPTATAVPTVSPTQEPTMTPTVVPTSSPTFVPSATPTIAPTATPTVAPTISPTAVPTATPTVAPTATATPTIAPTATASPTAAPTVVPTVSPTIVPTATPTVAPTATAAPTVVPTVSPTIAPTATPTTAPTVAPTATAIPTVMPTVMPTPTATPFPTPVVLPSFSIFRATTCSAQLVSNNTQVVTDELSNVYLNRGLWNVESSVPVINGISMNLRLFQVQQLNLLFRANPFFGGFKVTPANRLETITGLNTQDVLNKASAAWCAR